MVTPALAQAIDGSMTLRPSLAARSSVGERCLDGLGIARCAPGGKALDLLGLDRRVDGLDGALAGGQRRGLRLGPAVDADDDLLTRLDPAEALGVALDQRALHVVDGRDRAAHLLDARQLLPGRGFQLVDLAPITFEPSKMSAYSSRSVS